MTFAPGDLVCVQAGIILKRIEDETDEVWLKTNELAIIIKTTSDQVTFDSSPCYVDIILIPNMGMFFVPVAHLTDVNNVRSMKDYTRFKEW